MDATLIFDSIEEERRFCPAPMITWVCTGALCNGQGEQLTHEHTAEEDGVVGSPRTVSSVLVGVSTSYSAGSRHMEDDHIIKEAT